MDGVQTVQSRLVQSGPVRSGRVQSGNGSQAPSAVARVASTNDMTNWQLHVLEYFLTRHFGPDKKLKTIETGCGNSTVLFSKYSASHTVFSGNGTEAETLAIDRVRASPEFVEQAVTFVLGRSPHTLFTFEDSSPVDVALIGGSRSHPIPNAEYLAISSRLQTGSILVLRDVHIPSTQTLFRFLVEDDAFQLSQVLENTAFFWCANQPPAEMWREQRYNAQRAMLFAAEAYTVATSLPFRALFDGWQRELPACFKRGAVLAGGRPVSAGPMVNLAFNLANAPAGELEIEFTVVSQTPGHNIGIRCEINGQDKGITEISGPGAQHLRYRVDLAGAKALDIKLYDYRFRARASAATNIDEAQLTGLAFHSLAMRAVEAGETGVVDIPPVTRTDGSVVAFQFGGQELSFFVHDPHDSIQAHHAVGELYETEELALLAKYIKPGARILDVGANIGNHTVWFEKIAGASHVTVIEPQPRMIKHLKLNCRLNAMTTVDFSKVGCAFGNTDARGTIQIEQAFNPAGAMIAHSEDGEIPIHPGDQIIGRSNFDFIKIDTEGAELDVIEGLLDLIGRCRPLMFVEVANRNLDPFMALVARLNYEVIEEYRRYEESTNLLVRPKYGEASALGSLISWLRRLYNGRLGNAG